MPPTATHKDITIYLEQVEKDQIKPHRLPDCTQCGLAACYFKAIGGKEYTRMRRIFIRIQGGLFYA
ncbi:hypothetical protein DSCO28_68120 [Desulfosarcina ovata subsp. sediminis]|uniref:Uncharacterized protein n=1 Tax=Desulfosarcina ovata subsp. sediminis TaxID=885957 RepID=A0A5K8A1E2_9BACT|nr:hypothetical protein DSCO28_68120 [Desulfosarcina ovata subsp. sediminis]